MTEEQKARDEQGASPKAAPHGEPPQENHDRLRETTDRILEGTRQAWNTATFRAGRYRRMVQKRIDLSALHKKIDAAHTDLGITIDELRGAGVENIMGDSGVTAILATLDNLKASAAALAEEIEAIRHEEPPKTDEAGEPPSPH